MRWEEFLVGKEVMMAIVSPLPAAKIALKQNTLLLKLDAGTWLIAIGQAASQ